MPISAILGLLLLPLTLPNGMRLIELPAADPETAEIIVGYDEPNLNDLASTAGAQTLLYKTYAAGGQMEMIQQQDRTALRLTFPKWAVPIMADQDLAKFFVDVPKATRPTTAAADGDFRSHVEDEIRSALLPAQNEPQEYSSDDAFVAVSAPVSEALRDALSAIPRRGTSQKTVGQISRLPAERTLRFKGDLPTGGIIFAAPVPSAYYKEWYTTLLLDRVIHGSLPIPVKTMLLLSMRPYYYRIELGLTPGQFPEPAEDNFLQELQRLEFARVDAPHLASAKKQASDYLESKEIREWFASRGLPDRLQEGMAWVQATTADDIRAAVRDLLLANRVIASWPPKPEQMQVEVENLNAPSPGTARRPLPLGQGDGAAPDEGLTPATFPFPPHKDSPQKVPIPERLPSGVSLVASNINGVFVSGDVLTKYDHEPDADTVKAFQKYAANRLLVFAPSSALAHARELWSAFKGSNTQQTGVPKGPVSSGDLPALYVLKTMLDLKVIQAGWWHDVELRIDATGGSLLQIRADEEKRRQIVQWIKDFATHAPPDKDFDWMREVAIHRFDTVRSDLQALTWERDPQGTIQEIETIVPRFVQDVAQIYF